MKVDPYLHAVLVLYGAGKEVTAESIVSVVKAAGLQADEAKAKVLAEAVKDVNIDELLKEAATFQVAQPVAGSTGSQQAKTEEKKEEKEEKKEEEAAAGLASLFG
jgi:large subunit ribosomal protein L12